MAEYTYKQWGDEKTEENNIHADDCYRWQAGIEAAGGTWDGEWVDLDKTGKGLITADQLNALEQEIAGLYGSGFTAKTFEDSNIPGTAEWNRIEDALNTILNRTAFAIYCETDNSLTFYVDYPVPSAGETYNGKTVTNVYTGFDKAEYSGASAVPWYSHRNEMETVSFDKTFSLCQPIAMAFWFYGYEALSSVKNCANADVSMVTTFSSLFRGCSALSSLDGIDKWDTSSSTSFYCMFYGCTLLTDLSAIEKWDTSKCTNLGYMLFNTSIVSISLGSWNTENVTNVSSLFRNCSSLQSISGLENWNTENVTTFGSMFYGCSSLQSISGLENWNTENVTTFGSMFYGCSSLQSISGLENWNTENVTTFNYMFYNDSMLTLLDLSGWDSGNVADMASMFRACNELETIYAADGQFNTDKVTADTNMFASCSSIVGGNGTTFDSGKVDSSMAHIDTADNPGYFTAK